MQLMVTNIRLNKDQPTLQDLPLPVSALPAISNAKLPLKDRRHSHSAQKITVPSELLKNKQSKSTKRIFNESSAKGEKVGLEDLVVKKQSLGQGSDSRQNLIRTKVFSLKTPSRQGTQKEFSQTRDEVSNNQADRLRQKSLREFNVKMERLNE